MTLTKDIIVGYRHGCAVRLQEVWVPQATTYAVWYKGTREHFEILDEAKANIKERFGIEVGEI